MTDIALYPPGPARPTGGAGAIALLLGRTNMNGYKGGVQIDRIRASSI
jgi:3-hydroxy-3-methylglutaryl CoA synthase